MTDTLTLPTAIRRILARFDAGGYRADIVGGCVRDKLLGKEPNDYDLTTNASPEEVKALFSDCRTVDTGLKHGTVTLLFEEGSYEITTWRLEGAYLDHRRPSSVRFTGELSEDLSRRDFTVNAMAYSDTHGITDLFGGMKDLNARILRCVGDPTLRFREDALRILRALRFSATLGFKIECETSRAIHGERALLHNISVERIYAELYKLLSGKDAERVLADYADVIVEVLPTLKGALARPLPPFATENTDARLLSLFYRAAPSAEQRTAIAKSTLEYLHTDGAIRRLSRAVLSLGEHPYFTDAALLRLLYRLGHRDALVYLSMREALGENTQAPRARIDALLAEGRPYRIRDLAVGGDALLSLGVPPHMVGGYLESLLFAVIDGFAENTERALLCYLEQLRTKE